VVIGYAFLPVVAGKTRAGTGRVKTHPLLDGGYIMLAKGYLPS
jgi:hypothetical protein